MRFVLLPLCRRYVYLYGWLRTSSSQTISFTTCSGIARLERVMLRMTAGREYLHRRRRTLDKNAWNSTARRMVDMVNTTGRHLHVRRWVVECRRRIPSYDTVRCSSTLLVHNIRTTRRGRWDDGIYCLWTVCTGHTLNITTQQILHS